MPTSLLKNLASYIVPVISHLCQSCVCVTCCCTISLWNQLWLVELPTPTDQLPSPTAGLWRCRCHLLSCSSHVERGLPGGRRQGDVRPKTSMYVSDVMLVIPCLQSFTSNLSVPLLRTNAPFHMTDRPAAWNRTGVSQLEVTFLYFWLATEFCEKKCGWLIN